MAFLAEAMEAVTDLSEDNLPPVGKLAERMVRK
jgi:hypothetical protein